MRVNSSTLRLTDVAPQKDLKERRDQVIDPLHIPTRRVPDRPHIQHPLQRPLRPRPLPQPHPRPRPRHVDRDLVPDRPVQAGLAAREREADGVGVLLPLAREGGRAAGRRRGEVAEEELPGHWAEGGGDAGPGELAELGCGERE